MPKAPTTPKKENIEQAPHAPKNSTSKSSSKQRTSKPHVSQSQNRQAKKNSLKRKQCLDSSILNARKQAIDLTGDDSDAPAPVEDSSSAKSQQKPIKKPTSKRIQHSPIPNSLPILISGFPNSQDMIDDKPTNRFGPQESPCERPAKRARCEDHEESEASTNTVSTPVEQYHLASPNCSTTSFGNITILSDPFLTARQIFSDSADPQTTNAVRSGPEQESSLFSTACQPPIPLRNSAFVQNDTQQNDVKIPPATTKLENDMKPNDPMMPPAIMKLENKMKIEGNLIQQKSTSLPTLTEKIKLARELGSAFSIAERDAYQLLMRHDWVVDEAVLACMGIKTENESMDDGEGNKAD